MKRIFLFLLTLIIIFSAFHSVLAIDYDEEGAYRECCILYPEFINKIKNEGVTDKQLMNCVKSVERKVLEQGVDLTEENFDTVMYAGFKAAFKLRPNIPVREAIAAAYPNSAVEAMEGIITEEFMPIYITVKRFLLGITTPIVTLSGDKENLAVHYVHMPENAVIVVGFYDCDGNLLHAHKNPEEPMECDCESLSYAKAFALGPTSIAPLCDSFTQFFK